MREIGKIRNRKPSSPASPANAPSPIFSSIAPPFSPATRRPSRHLADALRRARHRSARARGLEPEGSEAVAVVRRTIQARRPDIIVTTTAFSSRDDAEFRARRSRLPDPASHSCRQREGSLGGFSARVVRRRSRHADRPAGIRRPHRRRSHLVQGRRARRPGARLLAPGAGTGCGRHRRRGGSGGRMGATRPHATARATAGARAFRLSRPRRTGRLRGRARYASQRLRDPRCARGSRIHSRTRFHRR